MSTPLSHLFGFAISLPTLLAAWRPFLDPLPLDRYWLMFMIPLVVGVSFVYKGIKLHDLSGLVRQSLSLAIQILFFMTLAASLLWLVTEWA